MAKRQLTTAAQAAKIVRKLLKKYFPGEKIKVPSDTYSMGNSIRVYVGGEHTRDNNGYLIKDESYDLRKRVEKVVSPFQYGQFNGMEDYYDMNNVHDFPQVKYVFVEPLSRAA